MDADHLHLEPDLEEAMQRVVDAFGQDVELLFGSYGVEVVGVYVRTDLSRPPGHPSDTQEAA